MSLFYFNGILYVELMLIVIAILGAVSWKYEEGLKVLIYMYIFRN